MGHTEFFSDLMRYGSVKIAGTTASTFLDALTLHRSPTLQAGLRENELRRWLRQDVVAKYLLGRRRSSWGSAHCVQKHWSTFLVLRPSWCRVVNILEVRRDLNRKTTHMSFPYRCQTEGISDIEFPLAAIASNFCNRLLQIWNRCLTKITKLLHH